MDVEYKILLSSPPVTEHLDSVKMAASSLTNNQQSIKIQVKKEGKYSALITKFTMKNAAQYKVVDEIDKEFKFWIWHFEDYEDSTISFS
ncbi:MAG: hypothetical protein HWQ35_23590 [Nostoc sp. NMS1]|uniref:hypothetical protein n=1 Tax=unclassified Nostoc TaxID=2593658 RepID=UPI0025ED7A9E|nr:MULTISPECIES: hypothetical protein [unclassified Nostoc]MBN3909418.1 hypothetical protein [Nostoc sp. NMS1]MBN3989096.1 hypothetical protein [Nostoc sp. NMS2]